MPMVGVGDVGMLVLQGLVPMVMRMGLRHQLARLVLVLVMLIMDVEMLVLHRFVPMPVR